MIRVVPFLIWVRSIRVRALLAPVIGVAALCVLSADFVHTHQAVWRAAAIRVQTQAVRDQVEEARLAFGRCHAAMFRLISWEASRVDPILIARARSELQGSLARMRNLVAGLDDAGHDPVASARATLQAATTAYARSATETLDFLHDPMMATILVSDTHAKADAFERAAEHLGDFVQSLQGVARADEEATVAHGLRRGLLTALAAGLVALTGGLLAARSLVRPIVSVTGEMRRLRAVAGEDLAPGQASTGARDEMAELRDAVELLRTSLIRIAHMARHDPLTDLPNRATFRARAEAALARHRGTGAPLALMCLDLDRFKAVNDTHGHMVGDELLRLVARRLRGVLEGAATLGRVGGDEFTVLLPGLNGEAARSVAERLVAVIGDPFLIFEHRISVGLSVGVAMAPHHGTEVDALVGAADAALYRAKAGGRGTFHVADERTPWSGSEAFALPIALACR